MCKIYQRYPVTNYSALDLQPCKTTRFHTFSNSSTNCMNSVFLLVLIIFQSTSLPSQPTIKILKLKENILHHFTPRGDQNINYLYNINTISSSQVTKKTKKFYPMGLSFDPTPNSYNKLNNKCMADSEENFL